MQTLRLECVEVSRRFQRHDGGALTEQAARSPLAIVADQFDRAARFNLQAAAIPVRDGVPESFEHVRNVPRLRKVQKAKTQVKCFY